MRATSRLIGLAAICTSMLAASCGSAEGTTPSAAASPSPPAAPPKCIEANEDGLPYSFCVPNEWIVRETIHSDSSIDLVMMDESKVPIGFGKAYGILRPDGGLNRSTPYPRLVGASMRRFLTEVGFEPSAVRDVSIETIVVDGHAGSTLSLTIDVGDGEPPVSRFMGVRVPFKRGAGVDLTFVWTLSGADEEVIRAVISTIDIDEQIAEAQLERAGSPG